MILHTTKMDIILMTLWNVWTHGHIFDYTLMIPDIQFIIDTFSQYYFY